MASSKVLTLEERVKVINTSEKIKKRTRQIGQEIGVESAKHFNT